MKTGINKVAIKDKKEGISLLVLIITIIVMIILAGAVILSITNNNPISKANETKVKTDLTALKDEYNNFYSSALFDNVSNTKGYYTDNMNITKEGNIIYKGKVVNENENNSLASIMPSIVGTEYEGKVFVADGKIYIDNRDKFLSEEQQEWAKEVGINVLNEGEVLVLSTEEVSLKISQKERIYATVMPDTDSQVEFDIDAKTLVRQLQEETNTVDIQGISDGIAILTAKVTGTEIEKKVTIKVNVGDYIKVSNITIDPSSVVLGLDEHAQLKAIITPETADNQEIEWKTEDDNIASVSEIGNITGENVGSTTITAIGEYGHITGECSVNVIDRTIITLDKKSITRRKGETEQITATVQYNTRQQNVTWKSDNPSIADVDENGLVTFKEVGHTTITATCQTKSVTCNIQVLEPLELKASSVEARGTKAKIKIDADTTYSKITKIEVKYKEESATNWTIKEIQVNDTKYNNNAYEIDGLIAEKKYNVQVTAYLEEGNSKTVDFTLTPEKIPVQSVNISKTSTQIPLGNTEQLTATVSPDDATYKGVDWKSDDDTKATVDANGLVTAKGLGKTIITVTSKDNQEATADCQVEVIEPISLKANIEPSGITDEIIPVKIETSTLHGTIGKIEILYKKKDLQNKYTTEEVGITKGETEYNGTYQIKGLIPNTEYEIQVKVTLESSVIPGHSKEITSLKGTTLKRDVTGLTLSPKTLDIPLGEDTHTLQATITPDDATNKGVDWDSTNKDVATVEGGKITTKGIGSTTITATSQDNESISDTCTVEVTDPITKLEVSPGTTTPDTIPVNINTETKHGNISNICVKYKVKGNSNSWQERNVTLNSASYNDTITLNGLSADTEYEIEVTVTILSPGDAADGRTKTSDTINIKTPKVLVNSVTLNKKELQIPLGNTEQLTATVQPTNATHKELTWQSSDTSVANVDQSGNITTDVVNGKIGNTTITVLSQDDPNKTATCTVTTVEPISLTASTGNTTIDTIPVIIDASTQYGSITSIQVKYKQKDTTGEYTTQTVPSVSGSEYKNTYNITNLTPDTVYDIQVIVTITGGRTMTKNNLSGTTKKIEVSEIKLDKTNQTVFFGDVTTIQLTATVLPANATHKEVDWSIDGGENTVATVDQTGKVTIKGVGTAKIVVTSRDNLTVKAEFNLIVQEAVAKIGSTKYATLQDAFNDVTGSSGSYINVEVLKNIEGQTATLENNKYAKLSLGAHTISNTSTTATITNKGNMQIEGSGGISNTSGNAIDNMSTLIINTTGTITSDKDSINNTKDLTVNNGTIKSTGNTKSCHGIYNSATGASLKITNGKVEGYDGVRAYGTVSMTEGEIHSNNEDAIDFANGTINITGGKVTGKNGIYSSNGGTSSSKVLTIGKNDDGAPSTTSPKINVENIGVYNGSSIFTANFYDGAVTGNTQFNDENEVNIPKGYGIVLNEKTETLKKAAVVNEPKILEGMTPITFDKDGKEKEIKDTNSNWYSYVDQGEYKHDGRKSHWANAKTVDGSQWVWIPRYAYKINYTNSSDKSQASPIDVIFLDGETNQYKDKNGNLHDLPQDYIVHPAFTNESENGYKNGGWDKELTGIWVAKYEASKGDTQESQSQQRYPKFVPGQSSYVSIKIGDIFTLCKNLNQSGNPYSFNSTVDTHLMKNSEWGAVAYLAQSKYGRNGVEVTQNKYDGNSAKTGYGASSSYPYSTTEGQKASTTGNLYGIYDMSGGASEYTAGYLKNGNSNLKTYGQSLLDETNNRNNDKSKGTSTKYVSVYNVGSTDNNTNNYNNDTNKARVGEAIWETSKSGTDYTSWFGDYSYFSRTSSPFLLRGGHYNSSVYNAGLFLFFSDSGLAYSHVGFRAVSLSL